MVTWGEGVEMLCFRKLGNVLWCSVVLGGWEAWGTDSGHWLFGGEI